MAESDNGYPGFRQVHTQQIFDAISHDLRAPARQVKSFTQLLNSHLSEAADDEAKEFLRLIGSAADVLQTKLDALTELSNAASQGLELEELRANDILEEALGHLALLGVNSFEVDSEALNAVVVADRQLLIAVFVQLVTNSEKFSPERVRIMMSSEVEDGRVTLTVEDDGPGFEARDPATAFNLFKRFHDGSYPGSGTGLTIVRTILDRHHADLELQTTPGSGTTIKFTLALPEGELA